MWSFARAKALALVPFDEAVPEPEVSFDLVACKICRSRYATRAHAEENRIGPAC